MYFACNQVQVCTKPAMFQLNVKCMVDGTGMEVNHNTHIEKFDIMPKIQHQLTYFDTG